jgi:hypothetical protein
VTRSAAAPTRAPIEQIGNIKRSQGNVAYRLLNNERAARLHRSGYVENKRDKCHPTIESRRIEEHLRRSTILEYMLYNYSERERESMQQLYIVATESIKHDNRSTNGALECDTQHLSMCHHRLRLFRCFIVGAYFIDRSVQNNQTQEGHNYLSLFTW